MKLSQNPEELEMMLNFIKENNVKSVLEIGSRYGETLAAMAQVMPEGSRIVSVELPNGPWGRPDSLEVLRTCMQTLGEKYDTHLLLGDSKSKTVIDVVESLGPFDFIFIDGDHSLDGVKSDWNNFGKLGKYVGFHDVNTTLDVTPFWNELKKDMLHVELISSSSPKMGIGIIYNENSADA